MSITKAESRYRRLIWELPGLAAILALLISLSPQSSLNACCFVFLAYAISAILLSMLAQSDLSGSALVLLPLHPILTYGVRARRVDLGLARLGAPSATHRE